MSPERRWEICLVLLAWLIHILKGSFLLDDLKKINYKCWGIKKNQLAENSGYCSSSDILYFKEKIFSQFSTQITLVCP